MKKITHTPMQQPKGRRHPSGHPIRYRAVGTETQARVPFDGPLSPGLQPGRHDTYAVGFTANIVSYDDED